MEKQLDQPTRTEPKTRLVEQIHACLRSGDYSRVLNLLRGAAAEFPNDAELSELEDRAHDGIKRNGEAHRLITQSQELFAQRKSAEAIQLLREAYELDKNNPLARSILANALVEQAHSVVDGDWLEAERLTNQALNLNPAHPTAKTVLGLIVARKETSSVEDWVSQARKLQTAGDLFAALAWVAEGLAVHPHEARLLQIQDEIQRDQEARRRQARRGDLEDLRRMQREIEGATEVAAKQALAVRIQTVAAKHWTDGEILSIANALLLRLGLVSRESSSGSPRGKGATVILHVPRPSAAEASGEAARQVPASRSAPSEEPASKVQEEPVAPPDVAAAAVPAVVVPAVVVPPVVVPAKVPPRVPARGVRGRKVARSIVPPGLVSTSPEKPQIGPTQGASVPTGETSAPARVSSLSFEPKQAARSSSTTVIFVSAAAAIILVAATFFFTREHYTGPVGKMAAAAPGVSAPVSGPSGTATADSAPAQTAPEPVAAAVSSDSAGGKVAVKDRLVDHRPVDDRKIDVQPVNAPPVNVAPVNVQPVAESGQNRGTLVVVAGQDDARVFLNGKLQRQLTRGGELRVPNLEIKDYLVQVSKGGFQEPPQQKIRMHKDEQARLVFNLQPQPRLASLTIQGGARGTMVLVDQTLVGSIQADGTLSVSTVNPGDHTVELRKERFRTRQFKEHFVAGGTVSLAAADAALEAAPDSALGELKITFTPADASIAIVKGDLLKMVSSGVPLNLPAGTYTLTARTAERFTRSFTFELVAGQSKTLDLSLAPSGMSKWEDAAAWKHEGDSFLRTGGDFVLYGAAPASGTFAFSAMLTKGHLLQWVLNYSDPKNYVLFQMDEKNFYRSVIRNGQKTDEIIVPDKGDKKSFRTLQIRVSPTEIVHQIKHGDRWMVLDRWTQQRANLSLGKFGFYLPGSDQVALSGFSHYGELNIR